MDGEDCSANFNTFIHAPFKDDCASGERNETSVALQIHLKNNGYEGKALIFGDLAYPTLKKIYEVTSDSTKLEWNVLLAPHHCSKSAMFWKSEADEEEKLKTDILAWFEGSQLYPNRIISSSVDFPVKDEPGKNPPHRKARNEYELITEEFLCTHEHIDEDQPHPIVFEVTSEGLCYKRPASERSTRDRLQTAITSARGSNEPPKERVGFGS